MAVDQNTTARSSGCTTRIKSQPYTLQPRRTMNLCAGTVAACDLLDLALLVTGRLRIVDRFRNPAPDGARSPDAFRQLISQQV
jgi:hypothetical protein